MASSTLKRKDELYKTEITGTTDADGLILTNISVNDANIISAVGFRDAQYYNGLSYISIGRSGGGYHQLRVTNGLGNAIANQSMKILAYYVKP